MAARGYELPRVDTESLGTFFCSSGDEVLSPDGVPLECPLDFEEPHPPLHTVHVPSDDDWEAPDDKAPDSFNIVTIEEDEKVPDEEDAPEWSDDGDDGSKSVGSVVGLWLPREVILAGLCCWCLTLAATVALCGVLAARQGSASRRTIAYGLDGVAAAGVLDAAASLRVDLAGFDDGVLVTASGSGCSVSYAFEDGAVVLDGDASAGAAPWLCQPYAEVTYVLVRSDGTRGPTPRPSPAPPSSAPSRAPTRAAPADPATAAPTAAPEAPPTTPPTAPPAA